MIQNAATPISTSINATTAAIAMMTVLSSGGGGGGEEVNVGVGSAPPVLRTDV